MVFKDDQRIEYFDEGYSEREDRYITIEYAGDVLMVMYTFRDPKYRIISARLAARKEGRRYHNGNENV